MKARSLRDRLLVGLVAAAGAVTLAGGVIVEGLVRHRVVAGFDQALIGKARALATLAKQHEDGVELDFADEFMPEFESRSDPQYFQVQLADGVVVELSRSFAAVPRGTRLAVDPPAAEARVRDVALPDGRPGRQVQVDFVPQLADELEGTPLDVGASGWLRDDEDGALGAMDVPEGRVVASIVVARERASLDARLLAIRWALAGTGLGLVLAVGLLALLLLHLGLRPVRDLAAAVGALDARDLARRVDSEDLPGELRPIAVQVDDLVARIAATLERERQLTSDIAHDLKTPVAELRALCDVGGRWPDDREAAVRFFRDAREVALVLERTIDRLLALARHDAGREVVQSSRFDVAEVLRSTAGAYRADAAARDLELEIGVDGPLEVLSDRERVGQILANLVENAVEHAAPETTITCATVPSNGEVALRISNEVTDLTREDLPHLFERFWRKDAARREGHAGLGLALARADAELLGIRLAADLDERRRFSVEMRFPPAAKAS